MTADKLRYARHLMADRTRRDPRHLPGTRRNAEQHAVTTTCTPTAPSRNQAGVSSGTAMSNPTKVPS